MKMKIAILAVCAGTMALTTTLANAQSVKVFTGTGGSAPGEQAKPKEPKKNPSGVVPTVELHSTVKKSKSNANSNIEGLPQFNLRF